MLSRSLPRFILLSFFIVWTTARAAAVSIRLDAVGTAQEVAAPGWGPKLQAGGGIAVVLSIPFTSWFDFATSLEIFGVLPSDTTGGFSYRGFGGGALGVAAEARFLQAQSPTIGHLAFGVTAGGAAALPAYQYTALYFYYPEARLGLFLLWQPARMQNLAFRLQVPFRYQFRRDMTFSFSTGLGIGVSYSIGVPP